MEEQDDRLEKRLTRHLTARGHEIAPPPADPALAVERARKRRRKRRIGTSALASAALVAAAIGTVQLTDSDGSVDVAAEGGPIVGEASTGTDDSVSDSAVDSAQAVTSGGPPSATLPESTGPVLQWSEESVDLAHLSGLTWWDDRFVAASYADDGPTIVTSQDGVVWEELDVPEGIDFWGLVTSGPKLVIWGHDRPEDDEQLWGESRPRLFSTDKGSGSWTAHDEISSPEPDVQSEAASAYLQTHTGVDGVAVLGDTVVASVSSHVSLDFERLAADRGIQTTAVDGWMSDDSGFSVCLDEYCNDTETYGAEELGLSQEEIDSLSYGMPSTRLLRSVAGGPWEASNLEGQFVHSLVAASGEFVAVGESEQEPSRLYGSSDGLTWEVRSSDQHFGHLTTDGTTVFASQWDSGESLVQSNDAGRTWTPVSPLQGGLMDVVVGPSGLVLGGQLFNESDHQEPLNATIEKDGYLISWSEDALELSDAETGEVVNTIGIDDFDNPTIIEEESGNDFSLTFLHPDTLEPLVVLETADLEEAFDIDMSYESHEEPDFFVGWSGDGQTWGYQTAEEAFGVNGFVQLAVGDGVVIAFVEEMIFDTYEEEASEDGGDGEDAVHVASPVTTRLFVATVE